MARWTYNCLAQKKLETLFIDGKISKDATSGEIRKIDNEFLKYSTDVFRVHFNTTKNKFGVDRKFLSITLFSISY